MKKILIIIIAVLCISLPFALANATPLNTKNDDVVKQTNSNDFLLGSPLFTQKETNELYSQADIDLATDGFSLVTTNDKLELYTNSTTGAVRVKNKNTKYIWATDVLNIEGYNFNNANRRKAQSAFEVVYRDAENRVRRIVTAESAVNITQRVSGKSAIFDVNISSLGIRFSYSIELQATGIKLLMNHESISETSTNKITSISFFPYFGAGYKDTIPGYGFIPSGNGGLVRFTETSPVTTSYSSSFYGTDYNRVSGTENDVLAIPVYGVVHGVDQNAMMTEIESGSSFATFTYSPSSVDQNFHMLYTTFNLRETYLMTIPGSNSILMVPTDFYKANIEINYSFLDNAEANYVGMAKKYQGDLVNRNVLTSTANSGSLDVHIEAFGRDYEEGLIFKKYHNMTTTDELLEINDELIASGVENIVYTLRGFNKKGYSSQKASNTSFDSSLGKFKDLNNLNAYFYYNPVESYKSKVSSSSNTLVNMFNERSYITVDIGEKYKFISDVDSVISGTNKVISKFDSKVALDGIGFRLYGDKNNNYTREEVLNMYAELLDEKTSMYKPNSYFWQSTDRYFNLSLYHDRLKFITDSVPFLQIVLRGYIDYYSPFLNFSTNQETDFLKCVEYGSNLAYLITKQQSYLLANTLSSNFYATHFDSNKNLIISQNERLVEALSSVVGQRIIDRDVVEEGVSKVTYSNNVVIYVNYTSTAYTTNGVTIPAMGYKVVK